MIIAIDGPAASGKGTLAKRIAAHFGLAPPRHRPALPRRGPRREAARRRARATRRPPPPRPWRSIRPRSTIPTCAAPAPARPPRSWPASREVRAALLRVPARLCPPARPGAVLDGRDIGTVVCPDADVKIYVTATPEVRAQRRYLETERPRRARHLRGGAGRHPPPRRARCRPRGVAHAAGRRRLLAGYQQFGYRSRIRHRRRCDPKEGRPARARLKGVAPIQLAQGSSGGRTHTSWAQAGSRGPRAACDAAIRPPRPSPEHVNRSRNEHRRQ